MSVIEKFKLFLQLWKIAGELKKMKKLLEFVDGKKTYIGALMVVGAIVARSFGVDVPEKIDTIGYGLMGVGFAHKLDKIKSVLAIAGKVLATSDKVVEALDKKEDKPA
jgi:hypothetical protein